MYFHPRSYCRFRTGPSRNFRPKLAPDNTAFAAELPQDEKSNHRLPTPNLVETLKDKLRSTIVCYTCLSYKILRLVQVRNNRRSGQKH